MKVRVGSDNPAKLAAVRKAFNRRLPDETIDFEGNRVDSGVGEQPMSIEEAIRGAINRAKAVQDPSADFAVGIEGGMSFYNIEGREYGIEISWVCVLDCKTGASEIACAPGFPVFPKIVKRIHAGQHLSEAMEAEYGLKNLGQQNGYIGWLSNDAITRESSNYEAVYLALSSLIKEESS